MSTSLAGITFAQASSSNDHQALTATLFLLVVLLTVGITFWASRNTKTAADYYAGGRSFSGVQNGFAIGGDYMSAASFLGISGAIALSGYDGFLYSIGFLVAWLVALLLVAELLRNSGRYTMADQLAYRMRQTPVRTAAATSTIVVSIFYLLAQMVGAGALVSLLLGVDSQTAKNLTIVAVGILMIFYVVIGGMKGTTWVQIVKAVLLMGGTILISVLVLAKFGFNVSDLLGQAAQNSGKGSAFLEPGLKYGATTTSKIDFISLGIALVLGTAGLPHILVRFYTVPTARQARQSVLWAIGIIGSFYLLTLILGFGAAALVTGDAKQRIIDSGGNLASPLLAEAVGGGPGTTGGAILLALISAVAFATILAVVAGLTLTSASSVAHDLYASVWKKGEASGADEIKVARISAFVIGGIAIALAIPGQSLNVAFLVALAFAVAASANLPALLFNLFWKRFNTRGVLWSIYGGLISSVGLVIFSPIVSGKGVDATGKNLSLLPTSVDISWFPLENPGIVSIPLGFLLGYLGTITSKERSSEDRFAELEVRSLTGAGSEK
ncbi:solute symporter family protein [Aeromicrobium fastidiosum]|uniref:Cation acetate symporter n=1 Tax=Aeromicrobium fastidiosum TaxID=52699 RepID=A0A641AS14_9ACTN|nr:cation acetate symporter [Aeromicrobium fastidiosum]KAA1380735.1 cation acetate symporter [Aeromicrobium fastidiosum]MBP2390352.1 cation/acetate symporter [Aeromicrobium fastidiosum]